MDNNKSLIRSCLISAKNGLTLRQLESDFAVLVGGVIPYRQNGFSSLADYLKSMPDVVRFSGMGSSATVHYVADESTAKIASLVQRQKTSKKKAKPLRLPRTVVGRVKRAGVGTLRAPFANPASQRVRNVRPVSSGAATKSVNPLLPTPHTPSSVPPRTGPASTAGLLPPAPSARQPFSASASSRSAAAGIANGAASSDSARLAKMKPKERFEYLREQLSLPVESVNTVPAANRRYLCNLSVGDISVLTYPNDFGTKEQAINAAYEIAVKKLEELHKTQAQKAPTVSDNDLLVNQIVELLSDRPNGLWMTSLVDQYSARFGSVPPGDWQDTAFESGRVRFDRVGADRYILYRATGSSGTSPSPSSAVNEAVQRTTATADADVSAEQLIRPADLPADPCFPVYVTCVMDDATVAMIIIGEDYNEKLDQLMTDMEISVLDTLSPVSPCAGQIYMTLVDGKSPHRVQVASILDTMVSAYFIDLGDTELLPADQLYQLSPRFRQLPAQAIPAQLAGVSLEAPGSRHVLAHHLLNKSFMCQVVNYSEKSLEVVLFDTTCDEDIKMNQLIENQLQTVGEPQLPEKHGFADVFVVHISCDEGLLYIQLDDSTVSDLLQMVASAAEAAQTLTSCRDGQLVLAQYEGDWFRARVLSVSAGVQVEVLFIDYGNSSSLEMCQLRHLPSHLHCPPQCLPVRLSGLPTEAGCFSQQVAEQLDILLPGDSTRVLLKMVSRPENEPAEVELFKRSSDGSIVAINTTLAVACREVNCASKKTVVGRTSSGKVSTVDRTSSVAPATSDSGGVEAVGSVCASPSPGSLPRRSSVVGSVRLSSQFSSGTPPPSPVTPTSCPRQEEQEARRRVARSTSKPPLGGELDQCGTGFSLRPPLSADAEQLQLQQLGVDQLLDSEGFMDVIVSYCSSPWNIYIQPYRQLAALRSLMTSLQQYFADETRLVPMQYSDIVPGQVYAVQHRDKLWYRARVTNVVPDSRTPPQIGSTGATSFSQAIVYFVDFGDFSHVPLNNSNNNSSSTTSLVQPLPGWLVGGLPAQAVKARLAGVGPVHGAWQSTDCVYFARLVTGRPLVAHVLKTSCVDAISGERLVLVQLIDTDGATDRYIHRALVESDHAVDQDTHLDAVSPISQFSQTT